jgi:hypothetical protein
MIDRCHNPKSGNYKRYGARGISVCNSWRHLFVNFIQDMGVPTDSSKSYIDRIDNDGNYEPGNCRWVTAKESMRNRSNTVKVVYQGIEMSLPALADLVNLPYSTLAERIRKHKWSVDDAINRPIIKRKSPTAYFATYKGETRKVADLCRELGLNYAVVCNRIRRGYTTERALGLEAFQEVCNED